MPEYASSSTSFSRVIAESKILSLYRKIRFRENPYFGIYDVVRVPTKLWENAVNPVQKMMGLG